MAYTTGKKLLVTKPASMDPPCDSAFRQVERFINRPPWPTSLSLHGIPPGGTAGQVLEKNTPTDYDVSWQTPSGGAGGLPPGGTAGQILMKNSSTNFDAVWSSGGPGTSAFGSGGQVLLNSLTTFQLPINTVGWDTAGNYINTTLGRLMLVVPGSFMVTAMFRITNQGNFEHMVSFFITHYNVGGSINVQQEEACHIPAMANYIDFAAATHVHSTVANDWVQFNVVPNAIGSGPLVQDQAQINWCSINHL